MFIYLGKAIALHLRIQTCRRYLNLMIAVDIVTNRSVQKSKASGFLDIKLIKIKIK